MFLDFHTNDCTIYPGRPLAYLWQLGFWEAKEEPQLVPDAGAAPAQAVIDEKIVPQRPGVGCEQRERFVGAAQVVALDHGVQGRQSEQGRLRGIDRHSGPGR